MHGKEGVELVIKRSILIKTSFSAEEEGRGGYHSIIFPKAKRGGERGYWGGR